MGERLADPEGVEPPRTSIPIGHGAHIALVSADRLALDAVAGAALCLGQLHAHANAAENVGAAGDGRTVVSSVSRRFQPFCAPGFRSYPATTSLTQAGSPVGPAANSASKVNHGRYQHTGYTHNR